MEGKFHQDTKGERGPQGGGEQLFWVALQGRGLLSRGEGISAAPHDITGKLNAHYCRLGASFSTRSTHHIMPMSAQLRLTQGSD